MFNLYRLAAAAAVVAVTGSAANAATATFSTLVLAIDNIYQADPTEPSGGAQGQGPVFLNASGGDVITFSSVTGSISFNIGTGSNFNNPDGTGSVPATSFNSGSNSIAGLTVPKAGFLVGLFTGPGGGIGAKPSGLNFTGPGGTSFTSLSPLLNQVFFIGDGLTGDGTGSTQSFVAPTGAGWLYLGFSDACGYSGVPSCYGDNEGFFLVSGDITYADVSATPLPAGLPLFASGLGAMGFIGWRRKRKAVAAA